VAGKRKVKIGSVIHSLSTLTSTNDCAKRLAQEGAQEGTVVTAEEQTEGRGTKGRSWHSPRGQGLYASVILRPRRADLSLLPLAAGLASAEAIGEAAGIEVNLKWPNDIVWRGTKLGGILCESEFVGSKVSFAILGIGLNLSQRKGDFPLELRAEATSLRIASRKEIDRERLKRALFAALDRWYALFSLGRKGKIVRAFVSKLTIQAGKVVSVTTEKGRVTGVFCGVDAQARVLIERDGRKLYFSPAEIVRVEYNKEGESDHASRYRYRQHDRRHRGF
jgi:BirA family biotin operon repressor/biotin-[acetyl-CoA-carboxylase] ligase